jgi:putative redox protein
LHEMKTLVRWQENSGFTARGITGHTVKIDDSEKPREADCGARPMELLLHGLAGCIGIGLVSICRKMRMKLTDVRMEIEGFKSEAPPNPFEKIHIHYLLKGEGLTEKRARKAIELSSVHCSVGASLKAEITTSFELEDIAKSP